MQSHKSWMVLALELWQYPLWSFNIPKGNYQIFRIGVMKNCQKVGIIMVIKCFKNWSYQKIGIIQSKKEEDFDEFWHRNFSTPWTWNSITSIVITLQCNFLKLVHYTINKFECQENVEENWKDIKYSNCYGTRIPIGMVHDLDDCT